MNIEHPTLNIEHWSGRGWRSGFLKEHGHPAHIFDPPVGRRGLAAPTLLEKTW